MVDNFTKKLMFNKLRRKFTFKVLLKHKIPSQGEELFEVLLVLVVELVLLAVVARVADSEQAPNLAATSAPLEPNILAQLSTCFLQAQT